MMAAVMSVGFTACGGDDDGGGNGSHDSIELLLSKNKITLASEQGSDDKFDIYFKNGTVDWKITQIPDFVTITTSEQSGNGNKTVTVTAKNNNDSDKDLTGSIIVEAKGATPETMSIEVTQKGLSGVSAEAANELLMCYSYAHGVSCGAKTKYFYISLYNQSTFDKMSEREVIADVVTGKVEDRETPSDENYYSWNLNENSSYVLAIVPYGDNDRQGKLYTKKINTKSSDSEPDVSITNFSIDWATDSYVWNVTKNTYCSSD